jgi:hypothetical protein
MLEDRIREFVIDTVKAKEIHQKRSVVNDANLKMMIKGEVNK